jgi:hypothetical protein
MPFEKTLPEWNAAGVEPPQSLKDAGWEAEQKPPADYFNWYFNLVYNALKELQEQGYTQSEIDDFVSSLRNDLDNVDITADSILTKIKTVDGAGSGLDADLLDGKHASDFAASGHTHNNATQTNAGFMSSTDKAKVDGIESGAQKNSVLSVNNKTGPVALTKADIGLGNVDNVQQASKSEFNAHLADGANPHGVTKSQVGLSNVDNVKQIPASEKGVANGVAKLDANGKVVNADGSSVGGKELIADIDFSTDPTSSALLDLENYEEVYVVGHNLRHDRGDSSAYIEVNLLDVSMNKPKFFGVNKKGDDRLGYAGPTLRGPVILMDNSKRFTFHIKDHNNETYFNCMAVDNEGKSSQTFDALEGLLVTDYKYLQVICYYSGSYNVSGGRLQAWGVPK